MSNPGGLKGGGEFWAPTLCFGRFVPFLLLFVGPSQMFGTDYTAMAYVTIEIGCATIIQYTVVATLDGSIVWQACKCFYSVFLVAT